MNGSKTEPKITGKLRFIRTQGHNNQHAHNGIQLRHGAKSVVLCTPSPVNDEEPQKAHSLRLESGLIFIF